MPRCLDDSWKCPQQFIYIIRMLEMSPMIMVSSGLIFYNRCRNSSTKFPRKFPHGKHMRKKACGIWDFWEFWGFFGLFEIFSDFEIFWYSQNFRISHLGFLWFFCGFVVFVGFLGFSYFFFFNSNLSISMLCACKSMATKIDDDSPAKERKK